MNQAEAKALVKKCGSIRGAAKQAGISETTLRGRLRGAEERVVRPQQSESAPAGRKLADFRAAYDKDFIIPRRVKEGLKKLGCTGWDYEVQFAKSIGVSLMDLGTYREQFADYVVQISRDGRRAWAGSVAAAKQMKEMVS